MRRVWKDTRIDAHECQQCVKITQRDYRLMLAVVRAAEHMHGNANPDYKSNCRICLAIDAFNAKPRKPR